ncbi:MULTISPECIES: hypothetical protein [Streptomyces]|uniref:Uncharacterized protein n=2 Tax=Streptomyces TaxID=1883 RepID=A0ABV9J5W9_9ACTN
MRRYEQQSEDGPDVQRYVRGRQALQETAGPLSHPTGPLTARMVLALQRTIGNAAVARPMELQRHACGSSCGHRTQQGEQLAPPVQRTVTPWGSPASGSSSSGSSSNAPATANAGSSSASSDHADRSSDWPKWPPPEWHAAIEELVEGNGLLGPKNKAFNRLAMIAEAEVRVFVQSLLAPDQDAAQAKQALVALYLKCQTPKHQEIATANKVLGPSQLASTTYNDLHEIISAKRMWQDRHQQLLPWPFNDSSKKPDYAVGATPSADGKATSADYYGKAKEVADHVRKQSPKDHGSLLAEFWSSITDKVGSYPEKVGETDEQKSVRVVVDFTDAPYFKSSGAVDVGTLEKDFTQVLHYNGAKFKDLERLARVDVLVPGFVISLQRGREFGDR